MPRGAGKLSCGAVIVRRDEDGWLTLMLRAYRNWDFPKGLCEPGESPIEACARGPYACGPIAACVRAGAVYLPENQAGGFAYTSLPSMIVSVES